MVHGNKEKNNKELKSSFKLVTEKLVTDMLNMKEKLTWGDDLLKLYYEKYNLFNN